MNRRQDNVAEPARADAAEAGVERQSCADEGPDLKFPLAYQSVIPPHWKPLEFGYLKKYLGKPAPGFPNDLIRWKVALMCRYIHELGDGFTQKKLGDFEETLDRALKAAIRHTHSKAGGSIRDPLGGGNAANDPRTLSKAASGSPTPPRIENLAPRRLRLSHAGGSLSLNTDQYTPCLDVCRELLAQGITGRAELWEDGKLHPLMVFDIERAAGLTVTVNSCGTPVFKRRYPRSEQRRDSKP